MIWIVAYLSAGALFWVFSAILFRESRFAVILALILFGWPVVGVVILWMLFRERLPAIEEFKASAERPPFKVRTKDLGEALSIDEIEARERVQDPLGAAPDLPFGHLNPAWATFKAGLAPSAPMATFSRVYGGEWSEHRYEGYAEVRPGEVKRWFVASIRDS